MDKSCIPVARLSGRTRVLQVADTQWPENFSHCTLHTVSLFPLSRCSNPSVRWSQILTHWSLSRKATVSQQQRFPTTASQPHCQSVRLLEQGFKLSIWLGRSLDPKHSPRQVYNWQEKLRLFWRLGCFQTTQIGSENPGQRTISARVASNTLETTSMVEHLNENRIFFESRLNLNLKIKNRHVSGQKPLNRRFQYQPLQHREGRWCIFIYTKSTLFCSVFFGACFCKNYSLHKIPYVC